MTKPSQPVLTFDLLPDASVASVVSYARATRRVSGVVYQECEDPYIQRADIVFRSAWEAVAFVDSLYSESAPFSFSGEAHPKRSHKRTVVVVCDTPEEEW